MDGDPVAIALRTLGLGKRYGSTWAVQGLDLTIRRGEIYGFLGPNGAGKTTTILMLLGIERPTAGSIEVLGHSMPADPYALNHRVGVVSEQQHLYDDLSAWDYLMYFARLYQVAQPAQRASELLERLGLAPFGKVLARDFSRGMQQKLGLTRALLHRPELLVLDEPVSGLDPHGIRQVREILIDERSRGTTILLSSHILSEIERTADRVGILFGGKLVAEDVVSEIGARLESGPSIDVEVEHLTDGLVVALRSQTYVVGLDVSRQVGHDGRATLRIRVEGSGDHRRSISRVVGENGGLIVQMHQARSSLEDTFIRLTAEHAEILANSAGSASEGRRRARREREGFALAEEIPPLPLGEGQGEGVSLSGALSNGAGTNAGGSRRELEGEALAEENSPLPLGEGQGEGVQGETHSEGRLRHRFHAAVTVARRDCVALLLSPGPYLALAIGMLVATVLLRGHLDALERNQLLILTDAFSLPLFLATLLAMLFLALASVAAVARDREAGTLETLFYAPIDPLAYLVGKHVAFLATYVVMAVAIGTLLAVDAGITGLRIGGALVPELILSLATAAATISLGLLLSSAAHSIRSAFGLFAVLAILLLGVRFSSELLSGIVVTNNYSPLLYARGLTNLVDRAIGFISPFSALEAGIDAAVRADAIAYAGIVLLSLAQSAVLLTSAKLWLRRRGVRR